MERLLFTGGTGFLGKNVKPLLDQKYEVTTCGITPDDMLKSNLATEIPDLPNHYDVVLHACGKAHMLPKTEAEMKAFYDVNYQGTVNLCAALEKVGVPKSLVFISTVAVYGCDTGNLIAEDHPRDGTSPYAKSKIMAEDYLTKWCEEHGVILGILRPSLLAGPGAPGNLGAMVNGIKKGFYVNLAGGKVKKSIMMVQDIAYLVELIEEKGGVYNVCDDCHPTFGEISVSIAMQLGAHMPLNMPYWMAWCIAKVGDLMGHKAPFNSYRLMKMTESLTFSNEKAKRVLGWQPLDVLSNYKI